MNFAETLRGLLRRWYITFPGIILTVAVTLGAWVIVPPSYERTATQLLLPGSANIPVNTNPLLYLGGLSFAADVLVRAVGSESTLNAIKKTHPDAVVTVKRDDTSAGPFIIVTVDAPTDAEAGQVVSAFVERTASELESLQVSQQIPVKARITVVPVAEDGKGTLQQRNRLVATVSAGVVFLALTLLIAGLVDGLSRRRRLAPEAGPKGWEGKAVPPPTDRQPVSRLARIIRRQRTAEKDQADTSPSLARRLP